MHKQDKIYVAGHTGLLGFALVDRLKALGYTNLLLRTAQELDLTRQKEVEAFFEQEKPDYVFLVAAMVGGILFREGKNAGFLNNNILIQSNVISSAVQNKVKKLIFIGSGSVYPDTAPQPIREEEAFTGGLNKTIEAYGLSKIVGMKLCEYFDELNVTKCVVATPTNLYGRNDKYDPKTSHVVPALIKKFHDAKVNKEEEVMILGSGNARREFLFADDLADALIFLMQKEEADGNYNIGFGEDISIAELAKLIAEVVGYHGKIRQSNCGQEGFQRKLLDSGKLLQLGWQAETNLKAGLEKTYQDFLSRIEGAKK